VYRALFSNIEGYGNVAIGGSALENNSTDDLDIAIGTAALEANTAPNNNTAISAGALSQNTTGGTLSRSGKRRWVRKRRLAVMRLLVTQRAVPTLRWVVVPLRTTTDGDFNTAVGLEHSICRLAVLATMRSGMRHFGATQLGSTIPRWPTRIIPQHDGK